MSIIEWYLYKKIKRVSEEVDFRHIDIQISNFKVPHIDDSFGVGLGVS